MASAQIQSAAASMLGLCGWCLTNMHDRCRAGRLPSFSCTCTSCVV